ncbi:MAG: hypothetical protein AAF918_11785 [Pseudomonadota bacterium]
MSDGTDLESNSWPGFVDILSAAIMMFVFFVLVTAVALFFHVIIFTSKVDPVSLSEFTPEQISSMQSENEQLKQRVAGLAAKVLESEAEFSQSDSDQTWEQENDLSMVVFFGKDDITLSTNVDEAIRAFRDDVIDRYGASNLALTISSPRSKSAIETIAKKIAVARIFNSRNLFLDSDLPTASIYMNVDPPTKINDEADWVRLKFTRR